MAPSLLFVKQTYRRILDLKAGIKGLVFLPITVAFLMVFVFFILGFLNQFPFFNLSWLGYNIAVGPYADQGFTGVLPFLPFLVYTFVHVNYFEEYYFRTNLKRVVNSNRIYLDEITEPNSIQQHGFSFPDGTQS
jgi:hypothetical protein